MNTITPQRLSDLMQKDPSVELIDVRMPIEYAICHAKGARLMPLDKLDVQSILAGRSASVAADKPLYVICKTGGRGARACEQLERAGVANVVNVEGGTDAWAGAGLPVVRTRRMSMERQTRIGAGILVLTGFLLGTFVHPGFYGLCAFIGAGLTFAGITDFCLMGMLFARMPWNKVSLGSPAACEPAAV